MPRKRRWTKQRHEMTTDVANLLLEITRDGWERFWGGPTEGRSAFEHLQSHPMMHVHAGDSYESWLARGEATTEGAFDPRSDPRLEAEP